jgi:ubiquinone/menaquinone biosynthesis C-methylase UbiE
MNAQTSWDPTWEKIFREQEWGKYPPEHVIRFVARRFYKVPDRRQIKLLDLGAGTGACTWFMAREGFDVSSIEGSPTAVRQAQERFAREGLTGDMRVGDFIQLPWPDHSFDAIVENGALCCNTFENCKRVITEVLRVLKPGGHFLSANLSNETWGFSTAEKSGRNECTVFHEGALVNRGFVLLMDKEQIDELYAPFRDVSVERASQTCGNMQHNYVDWWIVECRAPQA